MGTLGKVLLDRLVASRIRRVFSHLHELDRNIRDITSEQTRVLQVFDLAAVIEIGTGPEFATALALDGFVPARFPGSNLH